MKDLECHDRSPAGFFQLFESVAYAWGSEGETELAERLMQHQVDFMREVRRLLEEEVDLKDGSRPDMALLWHTHELSAEHTDHLQNLLLGMIAKARKQVDLLRLLHKLYHPPFEASN